MPNRNPIITPAHKPSYLHNPGIEPLSPLTTGQLVDIAAKEWPDVEAIISLYQGHTYTFAQVREKADRLAAGLLQLGITKGDRVGIWGPNSSEWFLARIATSRGGIIAVQIDPGYQPPQLLHSLTKVNAKALICPGNTFYERVKALLPELQDCSEDGVELSNSKIPSLKALITMGEQHNRGAYRFEDIISSAQPESLKVIQELQTKIQPDDATSIQFSSGTTGFPKAVLTTHRAVVNNCYFIGRWLQIDDDKDMRFVLPVLFCHTSGTLGGIMSVLRYGITVVIATPTFDIKKNLDAIVQTGAKMTFGTPSLYVDMIAVARQHGMKFPTLEMAGYGGAPCPLHVAKEMKEVLNVKRLYPLYGLTETGINFLGRPEDTLEQMTSTVGHITPHTEAMVVDENGCMVPMGTPGELWIRTYAVMREYLEDEEKTRQFITKDGWVKTGDLFVLQEDGYGKIVGRIKEAIIRIGDKIYPAELEEFFQNNPEILEAQVFGVPDDRVGEELCVYLRLKKGVSFTEEDIISYCRGKIPEYRIPRYIRFANEFPRSPMGKVIKPKLLEKLQQEISNK